MQEWENLLMREEQEGREARKEGELRRKREEEERARREQERKEKVVEQGMCVYACVRVVCVRYAYHRNGHLIKERGQFRYTCYNAQTKAFSLLRLHAVHYK